MELLDRSTIVPIRFFADYDDEDFEMRAGLYNQFDAKVLYAMVRKAKPRCVVDFAPREGRTTSAIVSALIKNDIWPVKYYVFEKDQKYLNEIKEYLVPLSNKFEFFFDGNIIESKLQPSNIDFLCIDANHDYILARWYIDNLFPNMNRKSIIHIHDMYYDDKGNGWADVGLGVCPQDHPDIIDANRLKELYPTIYKKYAITGDVIDRYEPDEIRDYFAGKVPFYSTAVAAKETGNQNNEEVPCCSMYFWIE